MLEAEGAHKRIDWPWKTEDGKRPSWRVIAAAVFLILGAIILILIASFEISYKAAFYPGSKIGKVDLSGLTREEAAVKLEKTVSRIDDGSIKVKLVGDGKDKLIVIDLPLSADSARTIINIDLNKTIEEGFKIGRSGNIIADLANQYFLAAGLRKLKAAISIDRQYLAGILNEQLAGDISKSVNAKPDIKCVADKCQIYIINESVGSGYDIGNGIEAWQTDLADLNPSFIVLNKKQLFPEVGRSEAEKLLPELEAIFISSSTPVFLSGDKSWAINKADLGRLVGFEKYRDQAIISIDRDSFDKWFVDAIAKEVNVEARDATVEMASGTITRLNAQQSGRSADIDKAYNDLAGFYRQKNFTNIVINLKIDESAPEVTMDNINDLGIKEIIGVGQSNFAGSPTNRRKNIKNGASKLHGKLISPGEEFSVMKGVMPVDAENGYFTELVIKGNKTTAEYGGGLCQIGTTMFRAALASGLPIKERANHSYNVTYYLENGLPGVDATIYDPKPDLRFVNDTGNYILIQARISGDNLSFEFWGTKDGRTASRTKPKVWGWKSPPATKLIETTDLKPGVKKCTETAHKGVSASFDYIVNYSDGHTATSTFTSVYKPWQEVCLIGVSSLSASSTPSE